MPPPEGGSRESAMRPGVTGPGIGGEGCRYAGTTPMMIDDDIVLLDLDVLDCFAGW